MKKEINISTKTIITFWLTLLGIAGIVGLVYLARWSIVIILVAFFLTLVLNRPTEFFARILPGHHRWLGATVTLLIALVLLVGAVWLIIPIFLNQSESFLQSLPNTIESVEGQITSIGGFAVSGQIAEFLASASDSIANSLSSLASSIGSWSVSFIAEAANIIGAVFIGAVLVLFMLIEGPGWVEKFWKLFPNKEKSDYYKSIVDKMYDVVNGYVTSQIIIATINAILAGIGIFVLSLIFGVPTMLIFPVAIITFIATFIPWFGPFVGTTIAGILTLLYSPVAALILIIYITIYQQFLWNLVSPKVQSRQIKISALLILIAITIGLNVGGVFGAIVAVPIAGCLIVLLRQYLYKNKRIESTEGKLVKPKSETK